MTPPRARRIELIAYLLGGTLLLGAFLFLGFSGFRSLAILAALVAVVEHCAARQIQPSLPVPHIQQLLGHGAASAVSTCVL